MLMENKGIAYQKRRQTRASEISIEMHQTVDETVLLRSKVDGVICTPVVDCADKKNMCVLYRLMVINLHDLSIMMHSLIKNIEPRSITRKASCTC